MKEKSFLGIGWGFPPNFRKDSGDITMVSDEEDIRQSLMIYFNTKTNERIMRPDYGCVLHDLQFERVNSEIIESLIFEIKNNIGQIEPRINVEKIYVNKIELKEGLIEIKLDYTVISTNIRDNIVYPYYINEGSHIK
tara:strand:+ start:233 stop:643 length:411 start_codon:yes stop_codon:yes gene_type:complete